MEGAECEVHRLVTFLGTGAYKRARYRMPGGGGPRTTPFVARALAEELRPREIVVVATAEAQAKHEHPLRQELAAAGWQDVTLVELPTGAGEAELWKQFEVIAGLLSGADGPVVLDITHGFRSQPFFSGAIVAFVRAVEDPPPDIRVYYGAYDVGEPAEDAVRDAPVWDLTPFISVVDWAQALRMFLKTGRAAEAADRTSILGRDLARAWAEAGREGSKPKLRDFGEALRTFGNDLATVRTGHLLLGAKGKPGSAERLRRKADAAREDIERHLPPVAQVLDRLLGMIEPLGGERTDLCGAQNQAVLALARRYAGLERYLEAAATLREGWINLYAESGATCPANDRFDMDRRGQAESDARCANHPGYAALVTLRNDLLHAQYRRDALDSERAIARIGKALSDFEAVLTDGGPAESEADALTFDTRDETAEAGASGTVSVFANISNHPSAHWTEGQKAAACVHAGRIADVPFPTVPPDADEAQVDELASALMDALPAGTTHALVQGEFTLTFALVRGLQARGVVCFAATSERLAEESGDLRLTQFRFFRLRRYPLLCNAAEADG